MKKLLGIIIINLFLNSNAFGGWTSNTPSLFGVQLESNISDYKQKNCLINHNYSYVGLDNFILTDLSAKDTTGPNWSDWIYTNSKLPVSEGCINPKVENDDFFNFHVKIFPKTKEIYEVSAIYKKVYKYKGIDLKNNLLLKDLNSTTSEFTRLSVYKTECQSMAFEIADVIVGAQTKEGFKFGEDKSLSDDYKFIGTKGRGKNKLLIEVSSSCSIKANDNNNVNKKDLNISIPFLVKVSISLEEYSTKERVESEKNLIIESLRGNSNPDINIKGLN